MPGYLYRTGAPFDVQLVIFGKDGTLLDSEAVRLPALKECTTAIAHTAGEPALLPALLKAGGWEDTDKGPTLAPDSVMACGTTLELAQRWIDTQPMVAAHWHEDAVALCAEMQQVLRHAALRDATSLGPVLRVLGELQQAGVKLAVVSDGEEAVARAQFKKLGWGEELFELIVGADSGHSSTGVSRLRAAMAAAGVGPLQTVVVGATEAELHAAQTAGCLLSVVVHPEHADSAPLPAALALAACRIPTLQPLPTVLAGAGHAPLQRRLEHARGGGDRCARADAGRPRAAARQIEPAALLDPARAVVLVPELDPELVALVDAMRPLPLRPATQQDHAVRVDPLASALGALSVQEKEA